MTLQTLTLERPTAAAGLTEAEVAERVAAGRSNATDAPTSRSFWSILNANLFTLFNLIIAVATVILVVLGHWQDALFSFAAVGNVIIGVTQEFTAKRKLDNLAVLHANRIRTLRDGREVELRMSELVLDDLIVLQRGDQVPADGVVIATEGLDLDESLLTGESDPVAKRPGDTVLSGSNVISGTATVQVARVGEESYASKLTAEAKRFSLVHSELRASLDKVVRWISWIIVPVALLVVNGQMQARGGWQAAIDSGEWQDAVVRAIASVTASVPQGLILMTSIAFAVAAVKLSRQQVLMQELAAVESLARVDVVCLDKTGTITDGTVAYETHVEAADAPTGWRGALSWFGADPGANATSKALAAEFTEPAPEAIAHVPFTSAARASSVSFADSGTWVLGAPDALFPDRKANPWVRETADGFAEQGKRAMVLAHHPEVVGDGIPTALTPAAVLVFGEHIREDAADTIRYFKEQGVQLRILSGDSPRTIGAVARQVGVPVDEGVFDASQMPESPEEQAEVLERYRVFGRVAPEQKRSIVEALQRAGHTVAMTGDGVNDALALKTADLGIAMGNGAPATKAVAKVVLLDGRFSHLPQVVKEGRQVTANIERVSRLFLTKTVYALLLALIFGIGMMEFPFLPRQLSATDGLTIGIPAFFLALMPNVRRYVPGFLERSLRFCIPAGAIVALSILGVTLWGRHVLGAPPNEVSGAVLITLTIVGLWVLAIQSRPFNWARGVLLAGMIVGMVVCFVVPVAAWFFQLQVPRLEYLWVAIGVGLLGAALTEVTHLAIKGRLERELREGALRRRVAA